MVALRSGYSTTRDIAKLTTLPSESIRNCLNRLASCGKVRIVEYKHCRIIRGMPTGQRYAVYAVTE